MNTKRDLGRYARKILDFLDSCNIRACDDLRKNQGKYTSGEEDFGLGFIISGQRKLEAIRYSFNLGRILVTLDQLEWVTEIQFCSCEKGVLYRKAINGSGVRQARQLLEELIRLS